MKVGDWVNVLDQRYRNINSIGRVAEVGEAVVKVIMNSGRKLIIPKGDITPVEKHVMSEEEVREELAIE